RLLGSPRYGERWARHWLDVVRYSESQGFERDKFRPNSWRYRDYVIDSFNADKPYDRFAREQIAGVVVHGRSPAAWMASDCRRIRRLPTVRAEQPTTRAISAWVMPSTK
ncbi:MAG: DUF1549 domain-containing protein, partial [Deltaproteobacteria bacterium]|nr:DUF1549 domain-containing protein [Deltaproteobacteria bacterium]